MGSLSQAEDICLSSWKLSITSNAPQRYRNISYHQHTMPGRCPLWRTFSRQPAHTISPSEDMGTENEVPGAYSVCPEASACHQLLGGVLSLLMMRGNPACKMSKQEHASICLHQLPKPFEECFNCGTLAQRQMSGLDKVHI